MKMPRKNKKNNNYLINVVLGADDRFEAMVKLIEGVKGVI